jgi:hypothetical protein
MSVNTATLASGFSRLKDNLLNIIGRIQGAKTTLDTMTGKVMGIMNLINQGVRAPRELAQALFNAASSVTGGILEIKNNLERYGRMADTAFNSDSASSKPTLPLPDNERNAALLFLSAGTYTLPVETATASQENTKEAVENLYRTAAFLTAAGIIAQMDSLSYKTAQGYWQLMETLEDRIDRENPRLYAAVGDLRTALSQELSGQKLSRELKRTIAAPTPLLYLAYYLGCDEDKIRELNRIADSFVISGDVIYV